MVEFRLFFSKKHVTTLSFDSYLRRECRKEKNYIGKITKTNTSHKA